MSMLPVVFIAGGVVLLVTAAVLTVRNRRLLQQGVKVDGVIVAVYVTGDAGSEAGLSYTPEVQFLSQDGVSHTIKSRLGSNSPKTFQQGQTVPVVYEPGKPEKARIASAGQMWRLSILAGAVGAIFLVVGVAMSRMP